MHPKRTLLALAIAAFFCASAAASTELAQKNNCLACHGIDKKIVGPAFRDVATKYGGQKDAAATVAEHIRQGGVGRWGQVPMPPQAQLSENDAKALANWILAGAK